MSNAALKTILFTGGALPDSHRARLTELGYELKIERGDLTETELTEALQDVSAYILGGVEKATRKAIETAGQLKVIAFFGVGYESYVDTQAATEHGIAVTNTPGANARSVAEFTISLMLDAVKRTTFLIESTRQGDWKELKSWNLSGKTLGIVGMGEIGGHVAQMAHDGFGMKIIYTGRSRKPAIDAKLQAEFVDLKTLLNRCDVLSLHAQVSEQTKGMIAFKELAMMKPHAVLINCSRAELVDAKALHDALFNKKLACAAFDGYYIEPAPKTSDDPYGLLGLGSESFLVSPHTAYFTEDATRAMADLAVESTLDILEGRPARNVVNPDYKRYETARAGATK